MKRNKDRAVLAAGLVALALVAGACAEAAGPNESTVDNGYEEVQYTPTSTTAAPASDEDYGVYRPLSDPTTRTTAKAATDTLDEKFLDLMDEMGLGHIPDDLALNAAVATCGYLAGGNDPEDLFEEIANDPFAPDVIEGIDNVRELPQTMGAASGIFCPY